MSLRITRRILIIRKLGIVNTQVFFTLIYSYYSIFLKKLPRFTIRFTCHFVFIFVINDVIYKCKAALSYSLLIYLDT